MSIPTLFRRPLAAAALFSLSSALFAQVPAYAPPLTPRMVNPAIDTPGKPFSYPSQPTDQIGVMYSPAGAEITPEGYLYTGYGEMMFFLGIDRQPLAARIRTLEDGYLPIVQAEVAHAQVQYRFTYFAASLGPAQDGTHVVNFVRVEMHNPTHTAKRGYLTTAWRYQNIQTTPYASGDNRFERPVTAKQKGQYAQQGEAFNPNWKYTASGNQYLRDGQIIYQFPAAPKPFLRPTYRDFYNLLDLVPVEIPQTATPQTPVATAEYDLPLAPGESRTLDFIVPLAPIDPASSDAALLQHADFNTSHQAVVQYWQQIVARGMQITTPEQKVNDTFRTSLVNDLLSLNRDGNDIVQTINQLHYHGFYLRDSADFVRMYDTTGYQDIARSVVNFFATKQQPDGNFLSMPGQYDGWGQSLWTYGEHYRMTHDLKFAQEVYPRILRAVDWMEQAVARDPLHLMPSTDVRDNEFVPGHLTGYNFLALNGLQAAELLAHDLGHTADEERFRHIESQFRASFMKQLKIASAADGGKIPPSLDPGAGGTDWGNLLSIIPEEQLDPHDPMVTATLRETQSRYQEGLLTYHQQGQGVFLHHYLGMKNTQTELVRGEDQQAIRELYAILLHTTSTHGGFEYSIRPWGDRDFSGNLSPHGWFAAEYRNTLRNMMVREQGNTLHLLSAISPAWIMPGSSINISNAATYFGNVDFTLTVHANQSATLHYTLRPAASSAVQQVVLHLPWFLSGASVTAGASPLKVSNRTVTLPANSGDVLIKWHNKVSDDSLPHDYQDAVERYKAEYKQRYEALTGDRQ